MDVFHDLNGVWYTDTGDVVATVRDQTAYWPHGLTSFLEPAGNNFQLVLRGEVIIGEICPDGSIRWSDGDAWMREDQVETYENDNVQNSEEVALVPKLTAESSHGLTSVLELAENGVQTVLRESVTARSKADDDIQNARDFIINPPQSNERSDKGSDDDMIAQDDALLRRDNVALLGLPQGEEGEKWQSAFEDDGMLTVPSAQKGERPLELPHEDGGEDVLGLPQGDDDELLSVPQNKESKESSKASLIEQQSVPVGLSRSDDGKSVGLLEDNKREELRCASLVKRDRESLGLSRGDNDDEWCSASEFGVAGLPPVGKGERPFELPHGNGGEDVLELSHEDGGEEALDLLREEEAGEQFRLPPSEQGNTPLILPPDEQGNELARSAPREEGEHSDSDHSRGECFAARCVSQRSGESASDDSRAHSVETPLGHLDSGESSRNEGDERAEDGRLITPDEDSDEIDMNTYKENEERSMSSPVYSSDDWVSERDDWDEELFGLVDDGDSYKTNLLDTIHEEPLRLLSTVEEECSQNWEDSTVTNIETSHSDLTSGMGLFYDEIPVGGIIQIGKDGLPAGMGTYDDEDVNDHISPAMSREPQCTFSDCMSEGYAESAGTDRQAENQTRYESQGSVTSHTQRETQEPQTNFERCVTTLTAFEKSNVRVSLASDASCVSGSGELGRKKSANDTQPMGEGASSRSGISSNTQIEWGNADELLAEIRTYTSQLKAKDDEVGRLEARVADLETQTVNEVPPEAISTSLAAKDKALVDMQRELYAVKQKLKESLQIQSAAEKARYRAKLLVSKVDELEKELAEVRTANDALQAQISVEEKALPSATDIPDNDECSIPWHKDALGDLRAERDALKAQLFDTVKYGEEQALVIAKLENEILELLAEREAVKPVRSKSAALSSLPSTPEEQERQLREVEQELDELRAQRDALRLQSGVGYRGFPLAPEAEAVLLGTEEPALEPSDLSDEHDEVQSQSEVVLKELPSSQATDALPPATEEEELEEPSELFAEYDAVQSQLEFVAKRLPSSKATDALPPVIEKEAEQPSELFVERDAVQSQSEFVAKRLLSSQAADALPLAIEEKLKEASELSVERDAVQSQSEAVLQGLPPPEAYSPATAEEEEEPVEPIEFLVVRDEVQSQSEVVLKELPSSQAADALLPVIEKEAEQPSELFVERDAVQSQSKFVLQGLPPSEAAEALLPAAEKKQDELRELSVECGAVQSLSEFVLEGLPPSEAVEALPPAGEEEELNELSKLSVERDAEQPQSKDVLKGLQSLEFAEAISPDFEEEELEKQVELPAERDAVHSQSEVALKGLPSSEAAEALPPAAEEEEVEEASKLSVKRDVVQSQSEVVLKKLPPLEAAEAFSPVAEEEEEPEKASELSVERDVEQSPSEAVLQGLPPSGAAEALPPATEEVDEASDLSVERDAVQSQSEVVPKNLSSPEALPPPAATEEEKPEEASELSVESDAVQSQSEVALQGLPPSEAAEALRPATEEEEPEEASELFAERDVEQSQSEVVLKGLPPLEAAEALPPTAEEEEPEEASELSAESDAVRSQSEVVLQGLPPSKEAEALRPATEEELKEASDLSVERDAVQSQLEVVLKKLPPSEAAEAYSPATEEEPEEPRDLPVERDAAQSQSEVMLKGQPSSESVEVLPLATKEEPEKQAEFSAERDAVQPQSEVVLKGLPPSPEAAEALPPTAEEEGQEEASELSAERDAVQSQSEVVLEGLPLSEAAEALPSATEEEEEELEEASELFADRDAVQLQSEVVLKELPFLEAAEAFPSATEEEEELGEASELFAERDAVQLQSKVVLKGLPPSKVATEKEELDKPIEFLGERYEVQSQSEIVLKGLPSSQAADALPPATKDQERHLRELREERDELKAQLDVARTATQEYEELKTQLDAARTATQEYDKLKAQLDAARTTTKEYRAENTQLQQELNKVLQERDALSMQSATVQVSKLALAPEDEVERQELHAARNALAAQLATREAKSEQQERELVRMQVEVQAARSERDALGAQLTLAEETAHLRQQELNTSMSDLNAALAERDVFRNQLDEGVASTARLSFVKEQEREIIELRAVHDALDARVKQLKVDNGTLKEALVAEEGKSRDMTAELAAQGAAHKEEATSLTSKLREKQSKISELQTKTKQQMNTNKLIQQEMDRLKVELVASQDAKTKLTSKLKNVQAQSSAQVATEIREAKARMDKERADAQMALEKEKRELLTERQKMDARAKQLKQRLAAHRTKELESMADDGSLTPRSINVKGKQESTAAGSSKASANKAKVTRDIPEQNISVTVNDSFGLPSKQNDRNPETQHPPIDQATSAKLMFLQNQLACKAQEVSQVNNKVAEQASAIDAWATEASQLSDELTAKENEAAALGRELAVTRKETLALKNDLDAREQEKRRALMVANEALKGGASNASVLQTLVSALSGSDASMSFMMQGAKDATVEKRPTGVEPFWPEDCDGGAHVPCGPSGERACSVQTLPVQRKANLPPCVTYTLDENLRQYQDQPDTSEGSIAETQVISVSHNHTVVVQLFEKRGNVKAANCRGTKNAGDSAFHVHGGTANNGFQPGSGRTNVPADSNAVQYQLMDMDKAHGQPTNGQQPCNIVNNDKPTVVA